MNPAEVSFRLLRHGLILFLLGLVSGLLLVQAPQIFVMPRLALSSHLLGAMGGMFLICVGLMVPRMLLTRRGTSIAYWLFLYGSYGNWLAALLGAIFGTGTMTPLASAGQTAGAWQENIVNAVLGTCGTATLLACVIFLVGLQRGRKAESE